MAEYCRTIFGDMLLTEPLEKFPVSGLHCGASGSEGWGARAGCQVKEAALPRGCWGSFGRTRGWGPIIYHVLGTVLGLGGMSVAEGQSQPSDHSPSSQEADK